MVALRLPPLTGGRIAAIVAEDDFADPALLFNVQLWAGMHYIRRSGLALLNSPWLDVPDNWLRVREPHPCQFLNPVLMRHCLADAEDRPDRPPLDVLVGVRTQPLPGPERRITAAIAGRYGLTRRVWDSPYLSIYARPDVRMSATFGGKP
ncbi:MAG: hypothetical protein LAQ30_31915 [Acidobacteriia bacterium]|nr:hypothetical protein [Terriglobia bacterium]